MYSNKYGQRSSVKEDLSDFGSFNDTLHGRDSLLRTSNKTLQSDQHKSPIQNKMTVHTASFPNNKKNKNRKGKKRDLFREQKKSMFT